MSYTDKLPTATGVVAANPMTTSGDIIYGGTDGVATRLVKGIDTQVLTLASGLPTWAAASGGSTTITQTSVVLSQNASTNIAGTAVISVYEQPQTDMTSTTNAISGGDYSAAYAKEYAFNNNISPLAATSWASLQTGTGISGVSYIGQSGLTKRVGKVRWYSYSTTQELSSMKLQYSNNGSTWIDIDTVSMGITQAATWYEYPVSAYTPSGATHFFRALANANLGTGEAWWCPEMELIASEYIELAPAVDYVVKCWQASGSQTLSVTRLKTGSSIPMVINYI